MPVLSSKIILLKKAGLYTKLGMASYIDFNDQHFQAGPCYHLGLVAKRKKEWDKACSFLLQALEIFMTYQNTSLRDACLSNLAQVWQVMGDTSLPTAIASIMNINLDEVTIALSGMIKSESDEKPL